MEFNLTGITEQEINAIGVALLELPAKIANPLIAKLQAQINEQQKPEVEPAQPEAIEPEVISS